MTEPMNEIERQIAEDEAKLAELAKGDAGDDKPEPKEPEPAADEPEVKEEPNAEPDKEGAGEGTTEAAEETGTPSTPESEEDVTPSASAFARKRIEARELAAKLKAAEEKLAAQAQPAPVATTAAPASVTAAPTSEAATDPEPNKIANYEEWLEWKDRQIEAYAKEAKATAQEVAKAVEGITKWREEQVKTAQQAELVKSAVSEFVQIEEQYKQTNPDYGNAVEFGRKEYGRALKLTNPNLTGTQIEGELDRLMIMYAAQAKAKGLNPAEELYDLSIARFGYTPPTQDAQPPEAPTRPGTAPARPKLSTIEANKKRAASSLSGGGQTGSPSLTAAEVEGMTNAEFSRLTPSQLRELEQEAS